MPFLGSVPSLSLLTSHRAERCCLLAFGALGMWFLVGEPTHQLVLALATLLALTVTFFRGAAHVGGQMPETKKTAQRGRTKPIDSPRYPEYLERPLNPGEHFRSKVSKVKPDE